MSQAWDEMEDLTSTIGSIFRDCGRAMLFMNALRTLRLLRWSPEASSPVMKGQVVFHTVHDLIDDEAFGSR